MKTPVNGLCVLLYFRSDFTTNFFGLELVFFTFTLIGDGTYMVFATSKKPCEPMIQKLNKCKPKLFPRIKVSAYYHLAGRVKYLLPIMLKELP